jgi:hypothetical protein
MRQGHGRVVQNSDYNRKDLQNLINELTEEQSDKRINIEEAINALEQMGNNSYKENIVLKQYIAKINDRIDNDRSSIGLNEDIHDTIKLHINRNIVSQDLEKHNDLKTEDLFKKIDSFLLAEEAKYQQVILIFGKIYRPTNRIHRGHSKLELGSTIASLS